MTSLICNLVDLIVSGVERMATEIVTQHLGCDNIRILVKDLIVNLFPPFTSEYFIASTTSS